MRVLLWHVHGSWTTAFVQGEHTYLLPVVPDRGPDGRGRAQTWDWPRRPPSRSRPASCATRDVDVVVLQRPHELDAPRRGLARRRARAATSPRSTSSTTRRRAGSPTCATRRPTATTCTLVHVTHFNDAVLGLRDARRRGSSSTASSTPASATRGELAARRGRHQRGPAGAARVTGTDLLDALRATACRSTCSAWTRAVAARRDRRRAPGPPPRRDGPAPRLPAPDPLDLARAVADRGDAPRDAGRRAGDDRGARGRARRGRRRLDARRRAARRRCARLLARPRARPASTGAAARRRGARALRARALPGRLGPRCSRR